MPTASTSIEKLQIYRAEQLKYHSFKVKFYWIFIAIANVLAAIAVGICLVKITEHELNFTTIPMIYGLVWLLIARIRKRLSHHKRSRMGYEQPFAEEIIAQGMGFALYLRGFGSERLNNEYVGVNEDISVQDAFIETRQMESGLIDAISYPIVALSDPRLPGPMPGAFRFLDIPENWEAFVADLCARSVMIILYVSDNGLGLKKELETIALPHRHKTLLILSQGLYDSEVAKIIDCYRYRLRDLKAGSATECYAHEFYSVLASRLAEIEKNNGVQGLVRRPLRFRKITPGWKVAARQYFVGPLITSSLLCLAILMADFFGADYGMISFGDGKKMLFDICSIFAIIFLALSVIKSWFLIKRHFFRLGKKHYDLLLKGSTHRAQ